MKVVLLAVIDEFEAFRAYLQEKGLNLGDFSIVALEPVLQVHLTKLRIDYKNTLPYFNNDSHKRIIVETERAMQFIREKFSFVDSNGLSNVYKEELALYIRTYLNHLYKLIEIIENIYDDCSDCVIYTYVERVRCADSWLITDDERYHGLIAMALAKSRNAKFVNINAKINKDTLNNRRRKSTGKRCKRLERLFSRCVIWGISDKMVILLPNQYHSLKSLYDKIGKKGIVLLSLSTTQVFLPLAAYNLLSFLGFYIFKKSYQRFIVNINFVHSARNNITEISTLKDIIDSIVDSETEPIYTYRGINCLDFVKEKVDASFKNAIAQLLRYSRGH